MAVRRLWVLLLLVGVFSMHGVQYASAYPGASPAATITPHGTGGASAGGSSLGSAVVADDAHATGGTAELAAAETMSMPEGPRHSVANHVLSLCLAVLLAGLVLLAAAFASRRVPAALTIDPDPRRLLSVHRLSRPPDLSSLCLLRI